jgi:uncharacterized protein (DUF1499 family)
MLRPVEALLFARPQPFRNPMRRRLPPEPLSKAAVWSRRIAVFAATVAVMAVASARFNLLKPPEALAALGSAVALALVALLLFFAACATIWRTGSRGVGEAARGLVLAALTLAWPAYLAYEALRLPVLADIATDASDPPHFSLSAAANAARGGFRPSGVSAAAREEQAAAYPEVEPIIVDLDADEAFALVLKTANARGWRLVEQRAPGGRLGEGHADFLDRTLVMGFDEDIAVRLRPLAGQTRIDLRSASRYGRHDFGTNARRIRAFAEELQSQADAR